MKRSMSVWLLCLTAVALLIPTPGIAGEEIDLHYTDPVPDLGMPLIVEHIKIEGNEDLKEKASLYQWPGNGTEDDPVVISEFQFRSFQNSYCPIINDTDLHVRIVGCHFSDIKHLSGYYSDYAEGAVLIQRSSNVTVENCTAGSIQVMVRSEDSKNIRIYNNTVISGFGGIVINRCESAVVEWNIINDIGIIVSDSYGTVIRNNSIIQYWAEMSISNSVNTFIENNWMVHSEVRFIIKDSQQTFLSGNRFYGDGLKIEGGWETYGTLYIGKDNFVNDWPLLSVRDTSHIGSIGVIGQLLLINVTDDKLTGFGNVAPMDWSIIKLYYCTNVTVSLGNSSLNEFSIGIYNSRGCIVEKGHISGGRNGILIYRSEDIIIRNLIFVETLYPITIEDSDQCTADNVTMVSPKYGFWIKDSSYNLIINSHIISGNTGIKLSGSSYHNSIVNNTLMDTTLGIPSIYDMIDIIYGGMSPLILRGILRTTTIEGTTLNGRHVLKLNDIDMTDRKIPEDVGCLILLNVTNLDLSDQTFTGGNDLLSMIECGNVRISGCNFNSSDEYTILMTGSRDIGIQDCSIHTGGIWIMDSSFVSITSCNFSTKTDAIYLSRTSNVTMNEMTVQSSNYVLISQECIDTSITNSSFNDSEYGIDISRSSGFTGYNLSLDVIHLAIEIRNSKNSRLENSTIKGLMDTLTIKQSSGDRIINNTFVSTSFDSFEIEEWHDSVFSSNVIEGGSPDGIFIKNSRNCIISNLVFRSKPSHFGRSGLYLMNVSDFLVEDNSISGFDSSGIYAQEIFNSTIQYNRIKNCSRGISVSAGSGNLIRYNELINNTFGSIQLNTFILYLSEDLNNNTIYGNFFIDNWTLEEFKDRYKIPAIDQGVNNTWYSEEHGGNYWTWVRGPDLDRDGFVDYPFTINGTAGSIDKYPMSHPDSELKNNGELNFIPDVMIYTTLLIFILLILAGSHKIGFHFKKDPDLNGD